MLETSIPVPQLGRELPRFTLRQEELPGIGAWSVGSKHYLIVKVEIIEKRDRKALGLNDSGDRGKLEGTLQILNIKPLGDEPVDAKTLEREDFERVTAKVRSGKI